MSDSNEHNQEEKNKKEPKKDDSSSNDLYGNLPAKTDQVGTMVEHEERTENVETIKLSNIKTDNVETEIEDHKTEKHDTIIDMEEDVIGQKQLETEMILDSLETRLVVYHVDRDETDKNIPKGTVTHDKNIPKGTVHDKNISKGTVTHDKDIPKGTVTHVYMFQQGGYYQPPPPGYYPQYGGTNMGQYEYGDRDEFIKKVFGICALMLFVVLLSVVFAHNSSSVKGFLRSAIGRLLFFGALFCLIAVNYALASQCTRDYPMNVTINFLGTVFYSYICAFIAIQYAPYVVIGAAGTTFLITLCCLGLAYTNFDFTKFILLVLVASLALVFASLFAMILTVVLQIELGSARIILLVISAVISSVLLVIEFQMVLGGKSVELGVEEYVFGAYLIFSSIVSIFMNLMGIIGQLSDD